MMQKSVLIISNEAGVRDLMANLLTGAGLRVSLAATGAEAIKILSNSTPDFVLCEQFLPDSSGVELKRRLLRLSPKSRVIVLSSFTIIRTSDDVLLEINDPFFSGNSHITMEYARAVAEEMKLSKEMVDEIVVASLLHDIGKLGIRSEILTEKKEITHTGKAGRKGRRSRSCTGTWEPSSTRRSSSCSPSWRSGSSITTGTG